MCSRWTIRHRLQAHIGWNGLGSPANGLALLTRSCGPLLAQATRLLIEISFNMESVQSTYDQENRCGATGGNRPRLHPHIRMSVDQLYQT